MKKKRKKPNLRNEVAGILLVLSYYHNIIFILLCTWSFHKLIQKNNTHHTVTWVQSRAQLVANTTKMLQLETKEQRANYLLSRWRRGAAARWKHSNLNSIVSKTIELRRIHLQARTYQQKVLYSSYQTLLDGLRIIANAVADASDCFHIQPKQMILFLIVS